MSRFRRNIGSILLLGVGTLAAQGCGCNLVGCVNGLIVRLAELPASGYKVEMFEAGVLLPGPPDATCAGPQGCPQQLYFHVQPVRQVEIRVTTSAGVRTTSYPEIKYGKSYPNGKRCGPECQQANVTAQVPG